MGKVRPWCKYPLSHAFEHLCFSLFVFAPKNGIATLSHKPGRHSFTGIAYHLIRVPFQLSLSMPLRALIRSSIQRFVWVTISGCCVQILSIRQRNVCTEGVLTRARALLCVFVCACVCVCEMIFACFVFCVFRSRICAFQLFVCFVLALCAMYQ